MYAEDDLIPLSALQHILFCERQFALIHIERAWQENQFTAEGTLLHERAHSQRIERRPGVRIETAMPVRSLQLGVSGVADVVEVQEGGRLYPVEYKRGRRKERRMDEVQLCAQAMCLEEMLNVEISEGALFYGRERRRKVVSFDKDLRDLTYQIATRAHEIMDLGSTPPPLYAKHCRSCSFFEPCMPRFLSTNHDVDRYLRRMSETPLDEGEEL